MPIFSHFPVSFFPGKFSCPLISLFPFPVGKCAILVPTGVSICLMLFFLLLLCISGEYFHTKYQTRHPPPVLNCSGTPPSAIYVGMFFLLGQENAFVLFCPYTIYKPRGYLHVHLYLTHFIA